MIVHDAYGAVVPTVWKLGKRPAANNTLMVETKAARGIISNYVHKFTISQNLNSN